MLNFIYESRNVKIISPTNYVVACIDLNMLKLLIVFSKLKPKITFKNTISEPSENPRIKVSKYIH
jgi:hypothetical protein